MAKCENHVAWDAALYIWWKITWRLWIAEALLHAAFSFLNFTLANWLLEHLIYLIIPLWAIKASLMDRYSAFTFYAESKPPGWSIFNPYGQVGWDVALSVWWAMVWRTYLIGCAMVAGAGGAGAITKHDAGEYLNSLYNTHPVYMLMFMSLASMWALRESLADRYRGFRFRTVPRLIMP